MWFPVGSREVKTMELLGFVGWGGGGGGMGDSENTSMHIVVVFGRGFSFGPDARAIHVGHVRCGNSLRNGNSSPSWSCESNSPRQHQVTHSVPLYKEMQARLEKQRTAVENCWQRVMAGKPSVQGPGLNTEDSARASVDFQGWPKVPHRPWQGPAILKR